MKYRVSEIAERVGATSQEVIDYLRAQGEYVRTSASSVEEPVARRVFQHYGTSMVDGTPSPAKGLAPSFTPPTTYTWQANPVHPPDNAEVQRHLNELKREFPIARLHLEMLQALGSQFVHSKTFKASDEKLLGYALARFSGAIEAAFGITREVMFFYAPYYDLQIRTFTRARELLGSLSGRATPDLILFCSPDDRLAIKLEDWSRLTFTAIPLAPTLDSDPISLIGLIRNFVYARDLFYETTPVHGDRFFGRKALLQELRDDILKQRVSGLFGLRKSGKTSLLLQVSELLSSDTLIPVFIDLEVLPSPPDDPTAALIVEVASRLQIELKARRLRASELNLVMDSPNAQVLKTKMQTMLARLSQSGVRVVLLLDEIEFLTPADQIDTSEGAFSGVAQVLGVLRSLVQGTDNFTFVLSGLTNAILENGRLYGRPNPLFSWAKARYIGPFSRVEADELAVAIGARMGIEIEPPALSALYEASGGHAYLYRNLASAVVETLPVRTYRRVMRLRDVLYTLVPWKRSIAGNIEEILGHLARYYPTESILLDVLMESPVDFVDIARGEDQAVYHLLSLGLIREVDGRRYQTSSILDLR